MSKPENDVTPGWANPSYDDSDQLPTDLRNGQLASGIWQLSFFAADAASGGCSGQTELGSVPCKLRHASSNLQPVTRIQPWLVQPQKLAGANIANRRSAWRWLAGCCCGRHSHR